LESLQNIITSFELL